MTPEQFRSIVRSEKVITIVRGISESQAVDTARALHAGGVKLVEFTCNTPGAISMIAAVAKAMKNELLVGAGTVITPELAEQVLAAGAQYVISPDTNADVIRYCLSRNVAVLPGATTPTEILSVKRLGGTMVKLFPAGAMGTAYVHQIRGPIDDMDLVAVGGVDVGNMGDYLKAGCVAVGLGSSVVRSDWIAAGRWDDLTAVATDAVAKAKA